MNLKSMIFLAVVLFIFVGSDIFGFLNQEEIEQELLSKFPEAPARLAEKTLDRLLEGKKNEIIESFSEEVLAKIDVQTNLTRAIDYINGFENVNNKTQIGYNSTYFNENENHAITYELNVDDQYLIYTANIIKQDGQYKLIGVNLNQYTKSQKEINAFFNFEYKGLSHLIFLALFIFVAIFTLYTSALCFGSGIKFAWLKSLFILCGIGCIMFNWTTGGMDFNIIRISFPTVTFSQAGTYAPLILSIKFPLGAVLYWKIWRHQNIQENELENNFIEEYIDKEEEEKYRYTVKPPDETPESDDNNFDNKEPNF